ncbi:MAG: response regulator transcription factor [Ignavibacteria bacterium]|jgi:two-component system invasion response regulator UvrY|nr:response regulator transcription factor [Ignavibacteria bacterium]
MINIIIVDDHAVVRKGVIQMIADNLNFYQIDEASSGNELLEKVKTNKYDIVILDISMPGKDGLDTIKELRQISPDTPVLVFSIYPEDQYAIRLLKAGASGYLNKDCETSEFLKAIERVSKGLKYISPQLGEILINNLESGELPLHETLSDREFQVMCMLAKGKTPTIVANELGLSVNTVSTYRIRILEKLKLNNTTELAHYVIKNRLVE